MGINSKLSDESGKHLSDTVLLNYLNSKETFSTDELLYIEAHLEICQECGIKTDSQISRDDSQKQSLNYSSPDYKKGIFKYFDYWKYAVAVFFALATFIILFYEPDSGKGKNSFINKTPDTMDINIQMSLDSLVQARNHAEKKIDEREIIGSHGTQEQYSLNVMLEDFIQKNKNSSNKIILLSPQMEEVVSSVITFKWQQTSDSGYLKLIVVDNRNTSVYNASVFGNGLTIDKRLKDGLYYWKLESRGKLEAVGKFLVQR